MKKILIIIIVTFVSCKEAVKEVIKTAKPVPVLEGQYYDIKNYPVKLFLPKGYKNIPRHQILKEAQNIENDFLRKQLIRSLESQIEHNIDKQYLLSPSDGSVVSLAEIPYMPLNKEVASQILGLLEIENQQIYEQTSLRRILIDKRFKSNKSMKAFKAVYQIEGVEDKATKNFFHLYVLEIGNKLYIINLEIAYEANFEPYFLKTRVLQ